MNRSRTKIIAASLAAVAVLAACGGDDDTADAPAAEPADAAATTTDAGDVVDEPAVEPAEEPAGQAPVEGPVSTLSPEIPDEYVEGLGPVDVIGDPLPAGSGEDDPAIGMAAPTLVGLDLDGNPIRIDPASDGPMMLVLLAHYCSHCNAEVPRLNELSEAGRFPDDLDIVAIATGSRPDAPNWPPTEWLDDTMEWTYPAMLDGIDMASGSYIALDAYGVEAFPAIVLIDENGDVAYRWTGEREPDEVIELINQRLGLT